MATNGERWIDNSNWAVKSGDPAPMVEEANDWYGLTFDVDGRLIQLILSNNDLEGDLPREIGDFDKIEEIVLRNNRLSGPVPLELGGLQNLLILNLGLNYLTGLVPERIGDISTLRELHLDGNQLIGMLPTSLTNLIGLRVLRIGGEVQPLCAPVDPFVTSWLNALSIFDGKVCASSAILSFDGQVLDYTFMKGKTIVDLILPVATGGQGPYTYILSPSLPAELKFDPQTRTVSGTPLAYLAATLYTYSATDQDGAIGSIQFRIAIADPVVGTIEGDWRALISLYEATDGRRWKTRSNWSDSDRSVPSESEIESWFGVTVTDRRVTKLELMNNSLTGSLPIELGNLTALEELELGGNALEGTIPNSIGNLRQLERLDLGDNRMVSFIPNELGNLTALRDLVLENNELIGEIPHGLSFLSNLRSLKLGGNALSGEIPNTFGRLGNVRTLGLGNNELSGQMPSSIGNMARLSRLFLHDNELIGFLPMSFTRLNALSELSFHGQAVCAPLHESLQSWLNGIGKRSGPNCSSRITFATAVPNLVFVQRDAIDALVLPYAVGGQPPYTYGLAPALPQGLEFDHDRRILSGIPADGADRNVYRYVATDIDGFTGELAFTIEVNSVAHETDWRALVSLYMSTSGGGWTENMNWSSSVSSVPEASELEAWYGVSMSEGRVTKLDLGGNDLAGGLPEEVGRLTQLTRLYLDNNHLTGEIPGEVGRLTQLTRLYLDNNELTGEIPEEVGRLTQLTRLYLDNNELTGEIPEEIGELALLRQLYLDNNALIGEIPAELEGLTRLEYLNLYGNALRREIPEELGELSQLKMLDLGSNRLTHDIPDEIGRLRVLTSLNLGGNRLSGAVPRALGNLVSLEELYLHENELTGQFPVVLAGLSELELLWFQGQELCAPLAPGFQSWLVGIDDVMGPNCRANTLTFVVSVEDQVYTQGVAMADYILPRAEGGQSPYTYTLSPELPAGLTFHSAARTISGTPTEVRESRQYTYAATDAVGRTGALAFMLEVLPSTLSAEEAERLPEKLVLHGNYPNPVATATRIVFDLPARAQVAVEMYDLLGRSVQQLLPTWLEGGYGREVELPLRHDVPSGAYVYRLLVQTESKTFTETGRVMILN